MMLRQKNLRAVLFFSFVLFLVSYQATALDIDINMNYISQASNEGRYYNTYDVTIENTSGSGTIFAIAIAGLDGFSPWSSGEIDESCTWAYAGDYPANQDSCWEGWGVSRYEWMGPGGVINVGWYPLNDASREYIDEIEDFIPTEWDTGEVYGPYCMLLWNNTHNPFSHTDTDHFFVPSRILRMNRLSFEGFEEGDYGLPELEFYVAAVVDGNIVTQTFSYPGGPVVGYTGTTEAVIEPDRTKDIVIDITNLTDAPVNWTLTKADLCSWITSVNPESGILLDSSDTDTVTITLDSTGLEEGDYTYTLSLISDTGRNVSIPVTMTVKNIVNLDEFAEITSYWQTTDCIETQPCHAAEWYIDGSIDILDIYQLASSWLSDWQQRMIPGSITDNFETGDFSSLDWTLSGDANWTITSDTANEGSFSARSGAVADGQCSNLELDIEVADTSIVSFAFQTSSEGNYDFLKFYIDGTEIQGWSGLTDWTQVSYEVSSGYHNLKWEYSKDPECCTQGEDCVRIDSVLIYGK